MYNNKVLIETFKNNDFEKFNALVEFVCGINDSVLCENQTETDIRPKIPFIKNKSVIIKLAEKVTNELEQILSDKEYDKLLSAKEKEQLLELFKSEYITATEKGNFQNAVYGVLFNSEKLKRLYQTFSFKSLFLSKIMVSLSIKREFFDFSEKIATDMSILPRGSMSDNKLVSELQKFLEQLAPQAYFLDCASLVVATMDTLPWNMSLLNSEKDFSFITAILSRRGAIRKELRDILPNEKERVEFFERFTETAKKIYKL